MRFLTLFYSEYLKTRRSTAIWLIIAGSLFTPSIIFAARMYRQKVIAPMYLSPNFWQTAWNQAWEATAFFVLPMGIIMATGLITQLEWRNNAWKQLHTTPQRLTTIFFTKFFVIAFLLLQFFLLFNCCLYGLAVLPALLLPHVAFPPAPYPFAQFLQGNINFFLDCLPIVGLQYALSLHFRNFLVPLGIGFLLWILSIGILSWEHSYTLPYIYCAFEQVRNTSRALKLTSPIDIHLLSVAYFLVFLSIGYVVYVNKPEKG